MKHSVFNENINLKYVMFANDKKRKKSEQFISIIIIIIYERILGMQGFTLITMSLQG